MRVRANATYIYDPVPLDVCDPPYGRPQKGQTVKVVNMPGCPKANVMNHCYIESLDGEFLGLVCCNSLRKQ